MDNWKDGLAWPEKLNTGNEKIDAQHKTLFKLISDMIEARKKGESNEKLGERLDFLANYTVEHFYYEEKFMIEFNYPGYAAHKNLHDDFKITVTQMQSDYKKSGSTDELVNALNKIVVQWVIQHIKREDIKVVNYIRVNNN